jgi:hypothetical protein
MSQRETAGFGDHVKATRRLDGLDAYRGGTMLGPAADESQTIAVNGRLYPASLADATAVRLECMRLAVAHTAEPLQNQSGPYRDDPIALAARMFNFVTGKADPK